VGRQEKIECNIQSTKSCTEIAYEKTFNVLYRRLSNLIKVATRLRDILFPFFKSESDKNVELRIIVDDKPQFKGPQIVITYTVERNLISKWKIKKKEKKSKKKNHKNH